MGKYWLKHLTFCAVAFFATESVMTATLLWIMAVLCYVDE